MDEFDLIRRYFDRQSGASGVVTGIGDDGAILTPTPNTQQVQVIDTLVEGVHFPAATRPFDIGYRVVAVNLSDIAAMGANPRWMTLALTLNDANDEWLDAFSNGLFEAAGEHGVHLVGGDTTRGPVITVTVTISGEVEPGEALLRNGAQDGEGIFVTGTLGDAAAGLKCLQRGEASGALQQRFLRPTARVETGRLLVGNASAAIDISDGLVGDLNKLLKTSGVGGQIDIDKLPLSDTLCEIFGADDAARYALTGGDDYELCFTADPAKVASIHGITRIGTVTGTSGLLCRSRGKIVEVDDSGYRHFQ
jgi:thiamine-monophosphate kinase